ncbi:uncharacterized protein LOC130743727 [Lotus japonicus]|uniref:uncharacterized protein LOC130743727 n=1 Tax=Lotus japonicus TaxID=34305 RepID=UPI002586D7FD|nr:uncharacterized protein LOC130743727 [Lotus japonicus]
MTKEKTHESAASEGASPEELDNLRRSTFKAKQQQPGDQQATPVLSRRVISYKDICVGINGSNRDEDEEDAYIDNSGSDVDEDAEEVEEGDEDMEDNVQQDPLFPVIKITKRELKEACKPWRKAIIVKLLGKKLGLSLLRIRLERLWQPMGDMEVIDLDNEFYIIRFSNAADYGHVFNGGPWVIMGHYLVIQQWKPGFVPEEGIPGKVAVWVRIPKFPVEFYGKCFLWRIGNNLGRMVRIDDHTMKVAKDGGQSNIGNERCRFARICVEVDLRKALVAKFTMNDQTYNVEYEGLNLICFHCGRFDALRNQGESSNAKNVENSLDVDEVIAINDEPMIENGPTSQQLLENNVNIKVADAPTISALDIPLDINVTATMNCPGGKDQHVGSAAGMGVNKTSTVHQETSNSLNSVKKRARGKGSGAIINSNSPPVAARPVILGGILSKEKKSQTKDYLFGGDVDEFRRERERSLGAGAKGFPLLMKDLVSRHSISCVALFETRVSGAKAKALARKLDFQGIHIEDAVGFSGGIWLFWDTNVLRLDILVSHRQYVHTKVFFLDNSEVALATFVYGSPQASMRDTLWANLVSTTPAPDTPWIAIGDFNAYQEASDKCGGAGLNLQSMQKFISCLFSCGLSDMGFKGPPFTWEGRGVKERIDRGVCNPQWLHTFPESVVLHLPQLKSDHKPLLLAVSGIVDHRAFSRPFRFQAGWLTHEDFPRLMADSWDPGEDWVSNVDKFRNAAVTWNDDVFGQIFHRKRRIMKRLEGVNNRLNMAFDRGLDNLQKKLWKEYHTVLLQEELFWAQKSRCLWFQFGDRNSKFFHTATLIRRKRNKIEALIDENGNLLTDFDVLQDYTVNFFRHGFMDEGGASSLSTSCTFPAISVRAMNFIQAGFSGAEVKDAIFSMGPLKAPGPDGLQAVFFQSQWEHVGDTVTRFVLHCFDDSSQVSLVNDTLLVLVPKVDAPERITQYRPISLCNVIYKTVTKMITNRLRRIMGDLVSPNQCSFVPGRHSSDNIVIAQEVFHSMRFLKRRLGWIAIKVDLEKAYDRLNWSFLHETLRLVAFNGGRSSSFTPQRGLRQGDPLSPYLFVLCMERLAHSIGDAVSSGAWKPIKLSRNGPPISHLFFADDLLLFGEATLDQMECIMGCLNGFCSASGMKVSIPKTRLMISKNVGSAVSRQLSDLSGISLTSDLGKYLGVPLAHKRVTSSSYQYILDRTQTRLSSWRSQMLNFAGRVTLTKSVIAALRTYSMQTCLLPKTVCGKLEKIQRDFIWGSTDRPNGAHSIAWAKLCCPKQNGGLGLRRMHDFNKSLVMKLGWGLVSTPDALWARVLRGKYSCGTDHFPVVQRKSRESHVWRAIRVTWPDVDKNLRWRIGSGSSVRFWYDSWVFSGSILINCAISEISPVDAIKSVADYFDFDRGLWRFALFQNLIPPDLFSEIVAMPPPATNIGPDRICWNLKF